MMKILVPVYGCSDCFAWLFAWFLTCLFLDDNGIVFLCIVCMFDLHMITLSCIFLFDGICVPCLFDVTHLHFHVPDFFGVQVLLLK